MKPESIHKKLKLIHKENQLPCLNMRAQSHKNIIRTKILSREMNDNEPRSLSKIKRKPIYPKISLTNSIIKEYSTNNSRINGHMRSSNSMNNSYNFFSQENSNDMMKCDISNVNNDIPVLENIQIKDNDNVQTSNKKSNNIILNISNFYNKRKFVIHHDTTHGQKPSSQKTIATISSESQMKNENATSSSFLELCELKSKIAEIMDQNLKLVSEKEELIESNVKLAKDIERFKNFIKMMKHEDAGKLSHEEEFFESKLSQNHSFALALIKEIQELKNDTSSYQMQIVENKKNNEILMSKLISFDDLLSNKEKEILQLKRLMHKPVRSIQKQVTFGQDNEQN